MALFDSGAPSHTFITTINTAGLMSIALEGFLYGVYTVLLVLVIRSLLQKKNKMTYIVILTGLWITITIGFAMDFMLVRRGYVFHNSSPLDMASYFIIDNDPSTAVYMIVDRIFYTLSMSIADGLMSWRCYILWDGNRWITLVLGLLFTATNVTGLVTSVPHDTFSSYVLNGLESFFYLCSAATTLLATTLIVLRIVIITNKSASGYSYRAIIQLLINSGFIYTAFTVITGTLILYSTYHVLPFTPASGSYMASGTIIAMMANPVTGLAPTLIALLADKAVTVADTISDSRPISHLTFRRTRHGDISGTGVMNSRLGMGTNSHACADYLTGGTAPHQEKGRTDDELSSTHREINEKTHIQAESV